MRFALADVLTDLEAGRLLTQRAAGLLGTPAGTTATAHAKRFCPDAALVPLLEGYLDDVRKRFHVKALGTNLLTLSFAARDSASGPRMVKAALAVREERIAAARVAATTALTTLYQKDYELAQAQALDAARRLQDFIASHPAPQSDVDQHLQGQLQLAVDLAQTRLGDLQGRIDRAVLGPALIEVSGMEFQIVDEPRAPNGPKGGSRAAMTVAAMAVVAGLALAALLVLLGAHLVRPATTRAAVPQPRSAVLSEPEALGSPSA